MPSATTIRAPAPAESWDDDFIFTPPSTASSSRTPPSKSTPSPARSRRSRGSIPKSEDDWDSPRSAVVAAVPLSVGGVGSEEREGRGGFGRKISLKSLNESVWDVDTGDEVLGKGATELSRSRVDELHQAYRQLAPALPINAETGSARKDHPTTQLKAPTLPAQPSTSTFMTKNEPRHVRKRSFPLPFSSPPITPRSSSTALATTKGTQPPPPPLPTSSYPSSLSSGRAPKNGAFLSRVSSRLSKRFSTSGTSGGTGSGGINGGMSTPRVQPRHATSASVGGGLLSAQTPHQMKRIASHIRPHHSHPEEDPESSTSRQVSLTSATTNDSSDAVRTPSPYTSGSGSVTAYADSRISSSASESGNVLYRLATSPSLTSMKFHLPSPSPGGHYASAGGPAFQWGPEVQGGRVEEVPRRRGQVSPTRRYVAQEREPRSSQDSLVRSSISSRSDDTMDLGTALKTWTFGVAGNNANMESSAVTPSKERSRKSSMQSSNRQSTDSVRRPALGGEQEISSSNSTIKRLSSLSWKHRRKVSDGWRFVSGAKTKSTTSTTASTSVESGINQVDPSTPRARRSVQYLPSVAGTPSPRPALEGSSRLGVPLPIRSSSHNGTPTSATVRVDDNESKGDSPHSFRRSSLGDLRIPSRVVSAQKGIREGVGMIKQFAAGVKDLQALMQQRTLLEIALTGETLQDVSNASDSPAHDSTMHQSPARSSNAPTGVADQVKALDRRFGDWWDMAEMLITFADTGPAEDPVEMDNEDIKKGRRVTVAATPNTGSLAGSNGFPAVEGARSGRRATTGRQTLSQRQLAVLQGMLSAPSSPVEAGPPRSAVEPRARSALKEIKVISMGPPPPPSASSTPRSRPLESSRRSSRSGLFGFKDMLRRGPSSDSLASPASPTAFDQTKSPRRPSLANIFRRSSSTFNSPTIQEQPSPPQIRRTPDKSPGRGSVSSTLSDWDRLDSPSNISRKSPTPSPERCTLPRSPTQMSKITGRGVKMSDVTVRIEPPHLQVPAPASTEFAVDTKGIRGAETPAFILTPENLPGLVKYLKEVTVHCKENVAGLEQLKARVRR